MFVRQPLSARGASALLLALAMGACRSSPSHTAGSGGINLGRGGGTIGSGGLSGTGGVGASSGGATGSGGAVADGSGGNRMGSGGVATGGAVAGGGGGASASGGSDQTSTGGTSGAGGAGGAASAGVNVLTHHNDNQRTGANLRETTLRASNVDVSQFGKVFEWPVDGDVYAQPLYVANVNIPGKGVRNVVYVVTMHNTLFAFDADSPATMPLWEVDLTALGSPIPVSATVGLDVQPGPQDIATEIGTLSTPVIDPASNTIYLVARSLDSAKAHHQKLHAIDLSTAAEKFGGPVEFTATVPATGPASKNGQLVFDPVIHNQRSALLLAGGSLYIAWAGHNDSNDFHGWVMAYDAATLKRTAAFVTTPNGAWGGIWQAGAGLAADDGHVYFVSGNGDFDSAKQNYGDSVLGLDAKTLAVTTSFTPRNQAYLTSLDLDLGSSGIALVPGTTQAVVGDKQGKLYLLDTTNLGGYATTADKIVDEVQVSPLPSCDPTCQSWQWTLYCHIHGTPVIWNGPDGPLIYVWAERDYLKAFRLQQNRFDHTPASQNATPAPSGMPGGFLSVSANGKIAGTGILWALHPVSVNGSDTDASASGVRVRGILEAYDASDVSKKLYDSRMNAARDDLGNFAKFGVPTVANGRVYVPTMSNQIAVYGRL